MAGIPQQHVPITVALCKKGGVKSGVWKMPPPPQKKKKKKKNTIKFKKRKLVYALKVDLTQFNLT